MYSGDTRAATIAAADDGQVSQETQPALEVIELANGETVWCVFLLIKRLLSFIDRTAGMSSMV
jgi:hypothetical protein